MALPHSLALRGGVCDFLLIVLLSFACFSSIALAAPETIDLAELDWQFRWDDAPGVEGISDSVKLKEWEPIAFPADPPGRNGHTHVWFRTILPAVDVPEPVIYITSIDLNVEAFIDDRLIYRFGEFDENGNGKFMGWPWHAIKLPDDYAGKPLYLRVYSDYTDMGLWGEVKILDRSDMLLHVISSGLHELIIAAFSVLIAFIAFVFAIVRGTRKEFFFLGLFSLTTAGTLLGENLAIQLVFSWPLLKTYLAAISYFAMPIFIAMLLYYWVEDVKYGRLLKTVATVHLVYLISVMLLSLIGVINLATAYPLFDLLFVLSVLLMLTVILRVSSQMNIAQQLVLGAFGVYAIFLLADMLVAHSFMPWVDFPMSYGGLIFSLVLVMVSIRNYIRTHTELEILNETLEHRVIERTAELHDYVEAEQERRIILERQSRFASQLESFNIALQSCHSLAEANLLFKERLADVFQPAQVEVSLGDQTMNALPDAQIRLQGLEGGSQVFASLRLKTVEPMLLNQDVEEMIQRTAQRLSVTLGNIKLREDLQRYSFEDSLTGLRNRRFFDDALSRDIKLAQREQSALSLLICDIDHFKRFNDDYGHEAGDVALQAVAAELKQHFRQSDIPCRLGGEEFVVLLRKASLEDACAKAERLRKAIAANPIGYRDEKLGPLTVSLGVATFQGDEPDAEALVRKADKALYKAKQTGRNRIEIFKED
ncbi:GGDEF domain-containing protein, partial [Methylophaga sp.]|uniref:GGDEF domain-containing protein n=1 Tax=Methylophaga sp. TaxID=2024840 RepID=UPI003F69B8CD